MKYDKKGDRIGIITRFKIENIEARYIDELDLKRLTNYLEVPIFIKPQDIFIYKSITYKRENNENGWDHK